MNYLNKTFDEEEACRVCSELYVSLAEKEMIENKIKVLTAQIEEMEILRRLSWNF